MLNFDVIADKIFDQTIKIDDTSLTYIVVKENESTTFESSLPTMFHNHAYGELFFCRKDQMLIKFPEGSHILSEGDILFVPPGISHITNGLRFTNSAVGIILNQHKCTNSYNSFKTLSLLFKAENPIFFRRYDPIFPEEMLWIEELKTSDSILPAISAYHTLYKLADNYTKTISSDISKADSNKNSKLIFQLESFISTKYYENITANQLAKKLYISPRQLARIVHKCYNAPLHKVITKKRVESAAKLLCESDLSVEEISLAVGFSTKSCFYRAFRKEYNMTPLFYRKSKTT